MVKRFETRTCSTCNGQYEVIEGESERYPIVNGPNPCVCPHPSDASDPNVTAASIVNQIANRD